MVACTTVEIECPVGERQHRGADDRRILSGRQPAITHVDGEYLAGQRAPSAAPLCIRRTAGRRPSAATTASIFSWVGGTTRKSVRPSAFVVKFDEIRVGRYPLDGGRADLFQCHQSAIISLRLFSTRSHPMPNPLYAKEILIAWIDTKIA